MVVNKFRPMSVNKGTEGQPVLKTGKANQDVNTCTANQRSTPRAGVRTAEFGRMPADAQGMAHSSNSVPGEKSVGHKTDNSTVPRQSRQSQWDTRLGQSHTQYRVILSK